MSIIKVDTIATRTGSGNITASNAILAPSIGGSSDTNTSLSFPGSDVVQLNNAGTARHKFHNLNGTSLFEVQASSTGGGGAIYVNNASAVLTITGCTFYNNSSGNATNNGQGGAIMLLNSSASSTITNSTFFDNKITEVLDYFKTSNILLKIGNKYYIITNENKLKLSWDNIKSLSDVSLQKLLWLLRKCIVDLILKKIIFELQLNKKENFTI